MRNVHILIIEDHSTILPYLQSSLEVEGFRVTSISNTQNALQHINDARWSLIILDRVFPSSNGTHCISEIRKTLPQTPILVLSDSPEKYTKEEMRKSGIEHYLLKPFAFQILITRIREILGKTEKHAHELTLDNLHIDTKNNVVKRDGKTLTLTKKELLLLTYLMKHQDHAVPRADLLEHVWGMQIDPLSNTIEAHILSLRHKIDTLGQTKLIHTVPKFGYRMSINK
jgi:DNA-binding response OmpR family regulator